MPTDEQLGRICRLICELNMKRVDMLLAKMELRDRLEGIGMEHNDAYHFVNHHYGTLDAFFQPQMELWKWIEQNEKKQKKAKKDKTK